MNHEVIAVLLLNTTESYIKDVAPALWSCFVTLASVSILKFNFVTIHKPDYHVVFFSEMKPPKLLKLSCRFYQGLNIQHFSPLRHPNMEC